MIEELVEVIDFVPVKYEKKSVKVDKETANDEGKARSWHQR